MQASVYLQVMASSIRSQADSDLQWVQGLHNNTLEQQSACKALPGSLATCAALLSQLQASKANLVRGALPALQSIIRQFNYAILNQLNAYNKVRPLRAYITLLHVVPQGGLMATMKRCHA